MEPQLDGKIQEDKGYRLGSMVPPSNSIPSLELLSNLQWKLPHSVLPQGAQLPPCSAFFVQYNGANPQKFDPSLPFALK